MNDGAVRDWTALAAVLMAVTVIAFGATARYGWIGATALWPVHILGLAAITVAIRKGAPRLLLVFAPVFLVPLGMGALLLYECSRGNCL